jgi:hypothetical protein
MFIWVHGWKVWEKMVMWWSFVLNLIMITFSQIKYQKKNWNTMVLDRIKKKSFIILMRIYCGIWNQKKLSICALMMMNMCAFVIIHYWVCHLYVILDSLVFNLFFTLFLPHPNHISIINKKPFDSYVDYNIQ